MPQIDINKSGPETKIIIAILIAGVVMIAGLLYWHNGDDDNTDEPASAKQSAAFNLPVKDIKGAQEIADVAAVSGKSVSGTVAQRPDYVSEAEWQVIQNVTKKNPNINLTNLVNKMLFIKKKEAWRAAGENTARRSQLARQLLDMIPDQLAIEAIDAETAKEMETKLNADLK